MWGSEAQEAAHTSETLFLIGNTAATAHQPRMAKVSGVDRSSAGLPQTLKGTVQCFAVLSARRVHRLLMFVRMG